MSSSHPRREGRLALRPQEATLVLGAPPPALLRFALAAALFAAALAVRLHRSPLDDPGGVWIQFVFSFWLLGALSMEPRAPLARRLGIAVVVALVAVVALLCFVRVVIVAPLVCAVGVLIVAACSTETRGARALHVLWLLVPLAVWGRSMLVIYRHAERLQHLEEGALARATLAAPDGRDLVLDQPGQLHDLRVVLAGMKPREPSRYDRVAEVRHGEIVLRDGTRVPWQVSKGQYSGSWVFVELEGLEYLVPFAALPTFDRLVAEGAR